MGAALGRVTAVSLLMIRSPGFGSGAANFQGALPAPTEVKLASRVNLLAHYAKGTLSLMLQLLALTPSFSSWVTRVPFPHGTVRYRSESFSLGGGVPHAPVGHLRPPTCGSLLLRTGRFSTVSCTLACVPLPHAKAATRHPSSFSTGGRQRQGVIPPLAAATAHSLATRAERIQKGAASHCCPSWGATCIARPSADYQASPYAKPLSQRR